MSVSASDFFGSDEQLKSIDRSKYSKLATDDVIAHFKAEAEKKTFVVHVVNNKEDALKALVSVIPDGSQITSTGSTTLQQIGYTEFAKNHPDKWDNLKAKLATETDQVKLAALNRIATTADYCITSVPAVTESAEVFTCDLTNTRVAPTMGASKLVVVIGSQKIVKDRDAALERMNHYSLPLESARVRIAYKIPSSAINFVGELRSNNPWGAPGRITFIVVKEEIGF